MDETYRWRLPPHLVPTDLPGPVAIESRFGAFSLDLHWDNGVLTVDLDLRIDVVEVSVDDYPDWRSFVTEVESAINRPVRFQESER
jgi:hypothetical protein